MYDLTCKFTFSQAHIPIFRCYYPCSTDSSYAESQSSRWAKWYPSREYADGMARFKFGHIPLLAKLTVWATHDPYVPGLVTTI